MPNKTEVWQRIISYCEDPSELVTCSTFINRTASLDGTKALWILKHPHSPLVNKLLNNQVLMAMLKSDVDYYNHSEFLDSNTEQLLSNLLEQKDIRFAQILRNYQPIHKLQKLVRFVSILIQQDSVHDLDLLLAWSNNEFNSKLLHLCLKANKPVFVEHLLGKEGVIGQIDWHDITQSHFLLVLEILKSNRMLDIQSISADLIEVVISRDLDSCLELLISAGLQFEDDWQLHLAVIKNSVKSAKILLDHGLDPHVDNDICIIDAASHGYTRLVHLFSKYADKNTLQKTLYSAIQGDQPEVVALLLEMPSSPVKCDQQAFYLASTKHGVRKESSRQLTVLELLLASSSDVVYLSYVGKNAVKMVSDYCKQVFTNIATK